MIMLYNKLRIKGQARRYLFIYVFYVTSCAWCVVSLMYVNVRHLFAFASNTMYVVMNHVVKRTSRRYVYKDDRPTIMAISQEPPVPLGRLILVELVVEYWRTIGVN